MICAKRTKGKESCKYELLALLLIRMSTVRVYSYVNLVMSSSYKFIKEGNKTTYNSGDTVSLNSESGAAVAAASSSALCMALSYAYVLVERHCYS